MEIAKCHRVLAIGILLSACSLFFCTAAAPTPKDMWGTPVSWEGVTTDYPVRVATLPYANDPFLVTDMREGEPYEEIESFDMCTLSIYRAQDGSGLANNRPVVFYVHGGAWIDGYASWYDFVAQSFTGHEGWVTVVIDYRLTSNEVYLGDEHCPDRTSCSEPANMAARTKAAWYDANLTDVAAALNWTLENIAEHGGDPERVVMMGHSAGAHLASLLVTHPDHAVLGERVQGVVSISGAYDLKMLHQITFGQALEQTFRGGAIDNDAELDQASPLTHVNAQSDLPPFYVLHAQQELPSLNAQTLAFRDHMRACELACDYDYLAGYSHETEMSAMADPQELPTILVTDWIKTLLTDAEPASVWIPVLRNR